MAKVRKSPQFLQALGQRILACEERWWWRNRSRPLAGEIGITDTTMSRYRHGKSEPTIETLVSLAKVAGVNLAWLVGGEGEPDRPTDERFVLDKRAFISVDLLDSQGGRSPKRCWGYIARECFSNIGEIPRDQPVVFEPSLACFQNHEDVPGQTFAWGTWVLIYLRWTKLSPGLYCLKGPEGGAYLRAINLDGSAIEVVCPRVGRGVELQRYDTAEFHSRYAVIGRVFGPMSVP